MYRNALKHFRLYVFTMNGSQKSEEKEVNKIEKDTTLTTTEKEAIVKARIGQGLYREKLLRKYSEGCIITHINIPEVLIASHIKPWSVSNNSEEPAVKTALSSVQPTIGCLTEDSSHSKTVER